MKASEHDIATEQAVIGGAMLNPSAIADLTMLIGPNDFVADQEHAAIWDSIYSRHAIGDPVDPLTLSQVMAPLKQRNTLAYLIELARNTPSAANVITYAALMREKTNRRSVLAIAQELATMAARGDESERIARYGAEALNGVISRTNANSAIITCDAALRSAIDDLDERNMNQGVLRGLSSGFADIDRRTNGFHPGDLIILAARPAMGKTTLAMNIAENVIMSGRAVLCFSMEMTARQIVDRIIVSAGRLDFTRFRSGGLQDEEWSMLSSSVQRLKGKKLYIDESGSLSISQITTRAKAAHKREPIALLIVDYMQLCRGEKAQNREGEIAEISRGLKALAKDLNIPIIALSQLNRQLENRADRRPRLADLRESGAIEQDADIVLFLHREEVYDVNTDNKNIAEVIFGKFRNGEIGTEYLTAKLRNCRFDNYIGCKPSDMASSHNVIRRKKTTFEY